MPVELKIGVENCRGLWAIDLHVQPEYRLRGIGAVLSEACDQASDVSIGLGISDDAWRSYRRAGWIDLGTVPLFVRPLSVGRMLRARGRRLLGWLAGPIVTAGLRVTEGVATLGAALRGVRCEQVERFDEHVDELWQRVAPRYAVICRRDSAFLNWRYGGFPLRDCYRMFYVWRRDVLLGYVVLRLGTRHGVCCGYVVDFLCEPENTGFLLAGCLGRLRRWGAAAAYCLHLSGGAARALRRLDFVQRESSVRLMVKPVSVSTDAERLLADRTAWFVTAGDSDADRPASE